MAHPCHLSLPSLLPLARTALACSCLFCSPLGAGRFRRPRRTRLRARLCDTVSTARGRPRPSKNTTRWLRENKISGLLRRCNQPFRCVVNLTTSCLRSSPLHRNNQPSPRSYPATLRETSGRRAAAGYCPISVSLLPLQQVTPLCRFPHFRPGRRRRAAGALRPLLGGRCSRHSATQSPRQPLAISPQPLPFLVRCPLGQLPSLKPRFRGLLQYRRFSSWLPSESYMGNLEALLPCLGDSHAASLSLRAPHTTLGLYAFRA